MTVALLGTASVWLLYLVGARLFDRAVGLLASAVMAVAFLPVFYGHLALNDVPTLAPLTLSLLGTAGVLRRGRMLDYLLAGVGLGLAAATKYTAGVMILPLLAAAAAQYRDGRTGGGRDVALGTGIAVAAALGAYLIANPYSLLDFHLFRKELELSVQLHGNVEGLLDRRPGAGQLHLLPVVVHVGARAGSPRWRRSAGR